MQMSQKLLVFGGSTVLLTVIFMFSVFDQILRFGIRDQTALRKRNEIRGIYLKLPITLDFKVYFFNVSNPMAVQNGEIPELKEIGPYCYDEYHEKIDVTDNAAEDSLTYSSYNIFKFNQDKSGDLQQDDYVTIIHPLVVGMVNQVTKDSPALLSILNKAISAIFPNLHSIYLTAKVKDILFEGVEIDCRVTDFPAKAVCTQLKSQIPGLKIRDKNLFLFSILGTRNATKGVPIKVKRGISNSKDLGRLLEVDGKKEVSYWSTVECNTFKGTDGWIFPPLIKEEDEVWTYSSDLCRNVHADFVGRTTTKGVKVFHYEATVGDMAHIPEERCYCPTPKTCLKKGVYDLTKCMGVPIYATLPHFLETDEMYIKQVHGMNPQREDHIIKILFEPLTATPLEAKKRLQFNLLISPNSKITLMQSIPEALHPIFWIEEGIELEGPLLKKIQFIFLGIKTMKIVRWIILLVGVVCLSYGAYSHFKNRQVLKITPTHQVQVNSKPENGSENSQAIKNGNDSNIKDNKASVLTGHEFDRY